ncbi:hypothetical protein AQUCO_00300871v1 [Aquilegia coerulea]|uniref:Peptidase A1 domain-containing protein n=1 Tax=Aquilegia coerulea TaxID=218851 RepID=A0A2G5F0Z2_AQUCA|nr:hypothetical protein AQUCO_00300871v1 [Aquilegia coerulea]
MARLHSQTDARINYYAAKIAIAASAKLRVNQSENLLQPQVIRPRISFQDSFYLAKVGVGTFSNLPAQRNYLNYFLMVDTGSNLIWTQCEPCEKCFTQAQPLFPYRRSTTYELLPCNSHRLCYPNVCKDQLCSYGIRYATGQNSSGYLGRERFAFEVDGGATDSVHHIVFGCGTNQQEIEIDTTPNHINGILGIGTGGRSLVNQLGYRARGLFSYCVPRLKDIHDNIFLRFGQEANRFQQAQQVFTTRLIRGVVETYYVRLLDISIAGNRLNFPPGYFDIRHDGTGGCIIDSGSPLTALPQEAYIRVRNAVSSYFAQRQLPTIQKPGFDLCFQVTMQLDVPLPVIKFHLQNNANLVLGLGAFLRMGDAVCLALKSSGDLGGVSAIIGSLAQSDYRFLFNLVAGTVSFARENCKRNS